MPQRFLCCVAAFTLLTACGDDTSGTGGGGGSGGASSTSGTGTGASGAGTGGAGGQGTGGQGTGGGPQEVPCDTEVCAAGDVCVITRFEPACTNLGEGEVCPEGTTETNCGGAGQPCCCEPTPPDAYACAAAVGCEDAIPTCECLSDPCEPGIMCSNRPTEGQVVCEEPPAA